MSPLAVLAKSLVYSTHMESSKLPVASTCAYRGLMKVQVIDTYLANMYIAVL